MGRARVALELRLGDAGLLEIELVELRRLGSAASCARWRRRGLSRRNGTLKAATPRKRVRAAERRVPGDRRAPVVPDDRRALRRRERVDDTNHVADEMEQRIGLDRFGPVRSARSRACRARPRGSPPRPAPAADAATSTRIPGSRGRTDERPFPGLGDVDAHAVRLDRAMCDLRHSGPPTCDSRMARVTRKAASGKGARKKFGVVADRRKEMTPVPSAIADHAVVIGAGMGGLAAAKAVAPYFSRVTVLDRDALPDGPECRSGTPQARHAHALLAGGSRALEALFPGIADDLLEAGALKGRAGLAVRYEQPGFDPFPQRDLGFDAFFASRPLLEHVCRARSPGGAKRRTPRSIARHRRRPVA